METYLINEKNIKHIITLDNLAKNIKRTNNLDSSIPNQFLLSAYSYIKNNCDATDKFDYERILRELAFCENNMPIGYICDCNTDFIYPKKEILLKNLENGPLLNALITKARQIAIDSQYPFKKNYKNDYNNLDTTNLCQKTVFNFKDFCNENNIKCEVVKIEPGFDKKSTLFHGGGFHYFNIIIINNKRFIVDVTYKQFFKIKDNFLQKLGIIEYPTTYPGIYMMLNNKRKKTALDLLKNGYIEYNEENLKNYLDGFALFFRNGLYYEQVGDVLYETNYTCNDYENFLFTDDSQVKRESKEVLGFQYKPLKNPNFDFSYHK